MFDEMRVERFCEIGDYVVTDVIPLNGGVGIGGVFAPTFAELLQVGLEFCIAAAEQGADEVDCANCAFLANPRKGCTAKLHKKSLGDIVHVMTGCNGVEVERFDTLLEKSETNASRGHFKRFAASLHDFRMDSLEGEVKTLGKGTDECVFAL